MIKKKRGFVMFGDLLKGFIIGFIVAVAVIAMAMWGLIPLPFSICGLC